VDSLLFVVQVVLFLCLSAACVYLIVVMRRVRDVLSSVEKDIKDVTSRAIPVLENMEYITGRVKSITDSIDDQVLIVRESVGSIREIADNVVALERKVQERIEGPLLDSVAFLVAIVKGVRTFLDRVRA
jgi:uncharacterized protein YoxC